MAALVTRSRLRKLLQDVLRTEADFSAFVLDHFPSVHERFVGGMDRLSRTSLLFECIETDQIVHSLIASHPAVATRLGAAAPMTSQDHSGQAGFITSAPTGLVSGDALAQRARLPEKPESGLPEKAPKATRKTPTSRKARPATLPPSGPTVPDPTAAVVPSQVLPPQPSTVTAQVAESSANPAQNAAEQRLRAKIAKAIKDKDGSVLLVVGAGVSMGATLGSQHAKSASWDGLLELGIARCKSHRPSARDTKTLQDALAERSAANLIKAAMVVERRLIAKADWKSWLHEMFSKLVPTQPAVLEALCELGLPLVTANYDGLLEYVGRRQAVTWRDHAMVLRFTSTQTPIGTQDYKG